MAGYPGKQGRKPTPTALHLLTGTFRADRHNTNEPVAKAELPPAPKGLAPAALTEYRRLGKLLAAMGVMTKIDRNAFARYCQAWARWQDAEDKCKQFGEVIRNTNGDLVPTPYRRIANQAHQQCRELETEFGLTPSARTRLHIQEQVEDDDPLDALMKKA